VFLASDVAAEGGRVSLLSVILPSPPPGAIDSTAFLRFSLFPLRTSSHLPPNLTEILGEVPSPLTKPLFFLAVLAWFLPSIMCPIFLDSSPLGRKSHSLSLLSGAPTFFDSSFLVFFYVPPSPFFPSHFLGQSLFFSFLLLRLSDV